jgi:hypothetical protein
VPWSKVRGAVPPGATLTLTLQERGFHDIDNSNNNITTTLLLSGGKICLNLYVEYFMANKVNIWKVYMT